MTRNNLHIVAALGAATFTLLVLFQLSSTFGFPQFGFLNLHYDVSESGSQYQIPILSGFDVSKPKLNGSQYLLGVGKADITGYEIKIFLFIV